jgi:hypothetical protein
MKKIKLFSAAILSLGLFAAQAQTEIPKGYSKGQVTLGDNTIVTGYIKENIRSKSAVTIIDASGNKKKYEGSSLAAAEVDNTSYICIKGDFFKVLCKGDLYLLQKASDASGIPVYNGSEAMFVNGTEGKPGDHFIYNTAGKELKLVSQKTFDAVTTASLAGCTAALDKAKTANGSMDVLKDAVTLYNNRNNK